MLTFRWKYKKLKQIEGLWKRLGHFHRTRSQAFAFAKMASAPKKTKADIAEHVFSRGQHELKTLNIFFESAFEDLSFHSF